MAGETAFLVLGIGILVLVVFFVGVTVLNKLDLQPSCILAGCVWLGVILAFIWLVTR